MWFKKSSFAKIWEYEWGKRSMGPSLALAVSAKSQIPALLKCFIEQKQTCVSEESCTRTQMYACVSQMLPEPRGSKTDLRRGFTDTKTRHTDAHWCSQPDNSVAPHWSWISRNVFANISPRVEVFFLLFYIFRQCRRKHTHQRKHTLAVAVFSFFWTGCFP